MTLQVTYWGELYKGKSPIYKEFKNFKNIHRFYSKYVDNDYLRVVDEKDDEHYILWDDITKLTII